SYADAAGRRAPSRSYSRPRSSRSRSRHNNSRRLHRPFQAELEHDIAGLDVPPLLDWQKITDQITLILEDIALLTVEFQGLQSRVKWLEDNHDRPVMPSPQKSVPMDQGWDAAENSNSRRLSDNIFVDLNSPPPPPNGPSNIVRSHVPLPPRQSLIPGLSSSPENRLSLLTATVTELTKT
ncbi:hypothetical protein RhiirA4_492147, partial [Rhizophagus irregularis]